jgi:predicted acylesterase/phospholipase RssA
MVERGARVLFIQSADRAQPFDAHGPYRSPVLAFSNVSQIGAGGGVNVADTLLHVIIAVEEHSPWVTLDGRCKALRPLGIDRAQVRRQRDEQSGFGERGSGIHALREVAGIGFQDNARIGIEQLRETGQRRAGENERNPARIQRPASKIHTSLNKVEVWPACSDGTLNMTLSKYIITAALLLCLTNAAWAETVALALSGGGARGFASIGVLQALEEEHLQPDLIVGTSIGAVIGGLYAAGYSSDDLRQIALSTDWSNLFLNRPERRNLFLAKKESNSRQILTLRFRGWVPELPVALTSGQQLSEMLFDLVHRAPYQPLPDFDDLRIPFRAVATDLISGKPVIFARGDLAEAMRASISLPLVFTPYRMDTLVLVDGGVVENIPVEIAHGQGADKVVAVDMSAGLATDENLTLPWELAGRVTTIMHEERNRQSRAVADVVITPIVGAHKATEFTDIPALIRSGYDAAQAAMPQLKQVLRRTTPDDSAKNSIFCSRTVYRTFLSGSAGKLPPERYEFSGVTRVADSTLRAIPSGRDGLRKLDLLRHDYLDDDYSMAHATSLTLTSDRVLRSQWQEGRIRNVRVTGLRRHRKDLVLRDFPLIAGDLFDLRRARRGISQIYGSDLFDSVTLSTVPSDSGSDLTIRVEERQSPQLRLGAGFSLERKGRGFVEFLNDNLLNLGAGFSFFGKYGERDEEVRGVMSYDRLPINAPWDRFLESYMTTELRVGWKRQEFNFYNSLHHPAGFYFFERSAAEVWIGRAFRRWSEIQYGARYEDIRIGGVLVEPRAHVTSLAVRSVIDTKDRYPFPNSGISFDGKYEFALRSRSTGRSFNRVCGALDGYVPLTRRLVLHGGADYAWNDRILPLWGQFQLGGENSLLGLHEAERYGNSRLAFLAETRYDLISRWLADAYISALYTVGAASPKSISVPEAALYQHGVGLSFGLATMLGPMKFTVGQLLDKRIAKRQTMFYLNLGHEF